MTRTVLFNCPIKAEIRAVDSQSDLRILLLLLLSLLLLLLLLLLLVCCCVFSLLVFLHSKPHPQTHPPNDPLLYLTLKNI